jgi:hypothetical protein
MPSIDFVVAVNATTGAVMAKQVVVLCVYYTRKYGKRHSRPLQPVVKPVFEDLRRSLDDMLRRATRPEDRRTVVGRMKSTLVQAKLGVDDLREALSLSRRKLELEQHELVTVRRRKELAAAVPDAETVAVAERFERHHEQRVQVQEQKIAVQMRELELAERELEEMKVELRNAMSGIPAGGSAGPAPSIEDPLDDPLADTQGGTVRDEIDSLARERARSERAADADRRLEELKRRMGK